MNPKQLEQLLLLEQSGELSPTQRHELDFELATSVQAQHLRAQLRGLARSVPPPATTPSASSIAAIHSRLNSTTKTPHAFRPAWKPALAAVAALSLLLGIHTYHAKTPIPSTPIVASTLVEEEWTDPLDSEFTELESLIATISTDNTYEITEI